MDDIAKIREMVGERVKKEESIYLNNEDGEWPDPVSLDSATALPDFPVEALPQEGREMVIATAEIIQVPLGMVGPHYLGVLSTALAKKFIVDLETHSEPLNLYLAIIANSGERKSAEMRTLNEPVVQYQKELQEKARDVISKAMSAHKVKKKKLEKLEKDAANEDDEHERHNLEVEIQELQADLDKNPVPSLPMLLVDDITPEALGKVMVENLERIAVLSSEAGIFEMMAGKYNEKASLDLYLKSHTGDSWSQIRISRLSQFMEAPTLTLCLMAQPIILTEIGQNKLFKGRGLLARFLYAYCSSKVGYRMRQHRSLPSETTKEYKKHVEKLLMVEFESQAIQLTDEAHSCFDKFYNESETMMRPCLHLEHIKDWGSKLSGAVARIAGLLHCAQNYDRSASVPLSGETMNNAVKIGKFFVEHALYVFGVMGEDPSMEKARNILEYINAQKPEAFKIRDVLVHKRKFENNHEVEIGLHILIDRGYVREIPTKIPNGPGRPEAPSYQVNPKVIS